MFKLPPLKPHQVRGIEETERLIQEGVHRIVYACPTGGGKTRVMLEMIRRFNLPTLLLTNRTMLLEQTADVLAKAGIRFGIRAAGNKPALLEDIQLSSIQTEWKRVYETRKWDRHFAKLVLVDERHSQKGEMADSLLNDYAMDGAVQIGFTATPLDLDGLADAMVIAGTNSELRENGMLLWAHTYAPDEPTSKKIIDGQECDILKLGAAGYSEKQIAQIMMSKGGASVLYGRVVEHWRRLNPEQKPTIGFAPGVKESLWFAEQCVRDGIPAAHIDGSDIWINGQWYNATQENRQYLQQCSKDGTIKILWNRYVMREGIDCLDDQTEVLTEAGWKGIEDDWSPMDRVWTLNKNTHTAELAYADHVMQRVVRPGEDMVEIVGQHMNIRVTEGHRFHLKYKEWKTRKLPKTWVVRTAGEVADGTGSSDTHFPIAADGEFPGVELSNDEIRLLAWYLTDGSIKGKRLIIYQSLAKPQYVKAIRDLLARLGVEHKETRKPFDPSRFQRKDGKVFDMLVWTVPLSQCERLESYLDKDGTKRFQEMTRRQFFVLFREMCKGDGSIPTKGGKQPTLGSARKPMVDLLSGMAVVRGYACNVLHQPPSEHRKDFWFLRIRSSKFSGVRFADDRSASISRTTPAEGERVWCVTNCNDTLIVRRKGKIAIIGNCPWLYHGIFATVFRSLAAYLQAGGRLLRSYPGMDHVIIQDHGGNWWRHGSLNEDRHWDLKLTTKIATQMRERRLRNKVTSEPIRCPRCSALRTWGRECPQCGYQHRTRPRMVIQSNGKLREVDEAIHKPRREVPLEGRAFAQVQWERTYFRARNAGMTFAAAQALFAKENNWFWPPEDFPLMPKREADWFRRVNEVDYSALTEGSSYADRYEARTDDGGTGEG